MLLSALTPRTRDRLSRLLGEQGGASGQRGPQPRGSQFVLVRCTSTTAAGGTGIGPQCFPAVALNPRADDDAQTDAGKVWLTVFDGEDATTPTLDQVYPALLSGWADNGGDSRPRAFAGVLAGFSGARVKRSTNQTGIVSGANTVITWEAEHYDVGGYWDAGSPTLFTVPSAGYYRVGASVTVSGGPGGGQYAEASIWDSFTGAIIAACSAPLTNGLARLNPGGEFECTAGTTLFVRAQQNSGVNGLFVGYSTPGNGICDFWVSRIG